MRLGGLELDRADHPQSPRGISACACICIMRRDDPPADFKGLGIHTAVLLEQRTFIAKHVDFMFRRKGDDAHTMKSLRLYE